jgi:dTDP-4-amino-4,6-dideoxygalactose transaminase
VDTAPGRVDFDYHDLARKLTPRTKAILPVSLWGCSYDLDRLTSFSERHHLAIIEDACQAHGALWNGRYLGTWGDLGCFSMRDGKLLSTGEGGFLLTNDTILAERCRAFRTHWASPDPALAYQHLGYNYRLPELLAVLGRLHLTRLDDLLAWRAEQARHLIHGLADVPGLLPYQYDRAETPNYCSPLFLLDDTLEGYRIARTLSERGVVNSVGTFGLKPVHEWPLFAHLFHQTTRPDTPHATAFLSQTLALSLLPHYTKEYLEHIISVVKQTLEEAQ